MSPSSLPLAFSPKQLEDNASQFQAQQQVQASQQAAASALQAGGFGEDHPKTLEDLLRDAEDEEGEGG